MRRVVHDEVPGAVEEEAIICFSELDLELIQSHMAQKPVLRGEVGCACVARERTKGMYRQRIQKAWGHTAHRGWARLLLNRARNLIIHDPAHRGAVL